MQIEAFLQKELWENPLQNYLWAIALVLVVLIFQRYIARILVGILYKLVSPMIPNSESTKFTNLMLNPIRVLFLLIIVPLILRLFCMPENWYDIKVSGTPAYNIAYSIYRVIIVTSISWVLLRGIDFVAMLLSAKARQTNNRDDDQIILFAREFFKLFIFIGGFLFILSSIFGFDVNGVIAGAGIVGLAVALAAKESVENLFASFTIFLERPFIVGDYVKLNETVGVVEQVGFRSSRIRTLDKTYVTIPNRKMVDSALENLSMRNLRRVTQTLEITYDTTPTQLRQMIDEIKQAIIEHAKTDNNVNVTLSEFTKIGYQVFIQYYFSNIDQYYDYLENKQDINFKIADILEQYGAHFAKASS